MDRIIDALWSLRGIKAIVALSAVAAVVFAIFLAIVLAVVEGTALVLSLLGFGEMVIEFVAAVEVLFCTFVFVGIAVKFDVFP